MERPTSTGRALAIPWREWVRVVMAAALPRRLLFARAPTRSHSICLTFDDGPHPEYTPRLLVVLKAQGIRATFFVVGKRVEHCPELVRRMAAEGHDVGHHSFYHSANPTMSSGEFMDDVVRTRSLLKEILAVDPTLFRPPYGRLSFWNLLRLWRAGQTVVWWNADPRDYACRSAREVLDWFQSHPLKAGDVVLMHDDCPFPAEVLPEIVQIARAQRLRFSKVSDWT
jgi:peptidoglycan/xylan/chitin deacetylase (PgdA/CDA1 family)